MNAVRVPVRLLVLLRPHQWLKNAFVLLGTIFAQQRNAGTSIDVALAFCAFCAVASAGYIFNDLFDAESDRQHPTKCRRPLADRSVSVPLARAFAALLAALAAALAWAATPATLAIVAGYALLTVAYTLRLKHIVIVDVFVIAAGFMLRILAGTVGVGIAPSSWLLLCGMMLTLFLGFSKRRAELLQPHGSANGSGSDNASGGGSRRVLAAYSPTMLDQFQSITATCTILSYALYTVSPETVAAHHTDKLIYTVPVVVFGIFRYFYRLRTAGGGQDPAYDVLTDAPLLATTLVWLAATLWILS